MDLQVWSKAEEKRAVILALRGDAVHRLEVSGNKARQEVPRIIGALQQGQEPGAVGANSVQTLRVASIGQVRVFSDQEDIELRADGENGSTLKFSTGDKKAAEIAQTVLARAGRPFRQELQDITAAEAVLPPLILGAIIGLFWALVYMVAGDLEAGKEVEVHGRRSGLKRLFVLVAQMLGVKGTLVAGVLLGAWIIGWAAMCVVRRPQRTVWQVEQAG